MKLLLTLILLAIALAACDNKTPGNNLAATPEPPKTMIDNQLKALDKAKGVEQQIQDAADKQRQAIDGMSK